MKLEIAIAVLAFAAGMGFQAETEEAQSGWKDWGENPMENPEFLAAMAAAGTPGAPHAALAKDTGEWNVEQTMYMVPDAPGMPGKATASSRMVLGGRVMIEEYKSDFMGMPMEGLLLLGYDNISEEYWSIWMDSFSTWPAIARGKADANGIISQVGQMKDVTTPGGRLYRHVSWHEDDGTMHAEMFDSLEDGSEFKSMEFTYKRK